MSIKLILARNKKHDKFSIVSVDKLSMLSVIPAVSLLTTCRDRLKPESSGFNAFWMPDQVRHDSNDTFIS
jgi:hypothetical protein